MGAHDERESQGSILPMGIVGQPANAAGPSVGLDLRRGRLIPLLPRASRPLWRSDDRDEGVHPAQPVRHLCRVIGQGAGGHPGAGTHGSMSLTASESCPAEFLPDGVLLGGTSLCPSCNPVARHGSLRAYLVCAAGAWGATGTTGAARDSRSRHRGRPSRRGRSSSCSGSNHDRGGRRSCSWRNRPSYRDPIYYQNTHFN